MDPCSHDEAAERVAASALTLALVDVEPDEVADLLVGTGHLEGLSAPERAIVSAHWRTLAWAVDQGYGGEADAQMEGIASALGLEHGVCDWEQLFSVFPDPWFVASPVAEPKLVGLNCRRVAASPLRRSAPCARP